MTYKHPTAMLGGILLVMALMVYAQAQPIKVFILSGQSNMGGHGYVEELPGYDLAHGTHYQNSFSMVEIHYAFDGLSTIQSFDNLTPGQFQVTFGPELGIAKTLLNYYNGEKLIFVKINWGGTILKEHWIDNAIHSIPAGNIGLFTWYKARITEALNKIKASKGDSGYTLCGIFWMQGESDGFYPDYASTYGNNLNIFVTQKLRPLFTQNNYKITYLNGELPFVYGKIHNRLNADGNYLIPYGSDVQSQQTIAQKLIPCVRCTDGTKKASVWPTYIENEGSKHPIHYNTSGAIAAGEALGSAMVDLFKGTKTYGCSQQNIVNSSFIFE
jgi:hypothetical protein